MRAFYTDFRRCGSPV